MAGVIFYKDRTVKLDRAVDLAIENVVREGLTDIFPDPFEVSLLKNEHFRANVRAQVISRIKSGTLSGLKVFPISHVLFPKKDAYDFRRAALIHPMDTICYLALILTFADEIESHRLPKRSNHVFSYRFKPNKGYLFDPKFSYTKFQTHVSEVVRSKRVKVLVKCDISNFYDRLNLHRLESTLLSLPIDKKQVKLTNELLLFWANRDSYSLPIGGNASRVLAEAALIAVDDYLKSLKVRFCRYVDDYRMFAPDARTAHAWLTLLVERLYLEGLSINPSKTVIEDVSEKIKPTGPSAELRQFNSEMRQSRIIAGYSGLIPTKFRELSQREVDDLKEVETKDVEGRIRKSEILQPDEIRRFLRVVVATGRYRKLALFPDLVEKFPQFTPLLTDLLIKKQSELSDSLREKVRSYFSDLLVTARSLPEYMLIAIVRLLGSPGFLNSVALMEFFRSLKRNSGAYVGRAVLDALAQGVNRTDVLEIRQFFARADHWEKRAIIRIVSSVLSEEEKRPWLKNVKVHMADDAFAIESFDPKKPKK